MLLHNGVDFATAASQNSVGITEPMSHNDLVPQLFYDKRDILAYNFSWEVLFIFLYWF